MKAIFICSPSRAYGEINTIVPLARGILSAGGEVWILASPLAAAIARQHFPTRVHELTPDLERNQNILRLMVKKFRPDLIALAELYEILRPNRKADCPLISRRFLRWIAGVDCTLVFLDFIAHVPMLRSVAECPVCAGQFGRHVLNSFLRRLWVVLPCPLNEPGLVGQRCGIPYRSHELPLQIDENAILETRSRFLGKGHERDRFLILRTGSTWQTQLAEQRGHCLYEHLGDILAEYLCGLPKPITVISISSRHKLQCSTGDLQIINITNLPPHEFDQLALSSDLVVTDNEIGYTMARTLGRVPGMVLVNSLRASDVLRRERSGSRLREIVSIMERKRPNCIYPHKIFPIPADEDEFADSNAGTEGACRVSHHEPRTIRLGRLVSSAFIRTELYGGQDTRRAFEAILCDPEQQARLKRMDEGFIDRLNRIDDGVSVLQRLVTRDSIRDHTVL